MRIVSATFLASCAVLTSVAAAQAGAYVYTLVGPAGATNLVHLGPINDAGIVVGSIGSQGMIWRAGVATPFAAPPGATFLDAVASTRLGIVLAHDTGADGTAGTYTYNSVKGTYRQLSVPGLTSLTGVAIRGNGDVVGSGTMSSVPGSHAFAVFDRVGMILDPPGSVSASARSIEEDGTVLGSATIGVSTLGFFYRNGAFTVLDPPGATASSVEFVEPDGTAVGQVTAGVTSNPFVYHNGIYTIVSPPGAISTQGGISKNGTVVGSFTTATEIDGFTYKNGVYTIIDDPDALAFPPYHPKETHAFFEGPNGEVFGYFVYGIPAVVFEYKDGVYTSGSLEGGFPARLLSDGRIFGSGWYEKNGVVFVGTLPSMHVLIPAQFYNDNFFSINRRGEFTGVGQLRSSGYDQDFIATCPASQAPCDQ